MKAQSLGAKEREFFLQTLDIEDPAAAGKVSELIDIARQFDGFMMTAVGDPIEAEMPRHKNGDEIGGWKIEGLIGTGVGVWMCSRPS